MLEGGYVDERWWCKEGSNFVKKMKLAAPRFWLRSENDDVNSTNVTVHLSSVYVKTRGTKSGIVRSSCQFPLAELQLQGSCHMAHQHLEFHQKLSSKLCEPTLFFI